MGTPMITGWESELPSADSLVRQFILSYADRSEAMAVAVGGRTDRDDLACIVDLVSPVLFDNAVVLLRPPGANGLTAVLDRARAMFSPDRAWVLLSAFALPDPSDYGLQLMGHPPLMLRPPGGDAPPPVAELRIQPVTSELDMAVFHQVLVDGFDMPGVVGAMADPRVLAAGLKLFIGYAGSTPVAVSGSAINHNVVDVEWVATVPEARGRGYGTALTWRAVQLAPELPAMLIASDPGQPVYERLGFLRLMRLTMWCHPGAGTSEPAT